MTDIKNLAVIFNYCLLLKFNVRSIVGTNTQKNDIPNDYFCKF